MGDGNIHPSRFIVQSAVFEARTQGAIPIAEVFTNSPLDLPVEFALRHSLAEKSGQQPETKPVKVLRSPRDP